MAQAQCEQVVGKKAPVRRVGEDGSQACRPPGPVWEQAHCPAAVVLVSRVYVRGPGAPARIGQQLAFMAIDVLAPIYAPIVAPAQRAVRLRLAKWGVEEYKDLFSASVGLTHYSRCLFDSFPHRPLKVFTGVAAYKVHCFEGVTLRP